MIELKIDPEFRDVLPSKEEDYLKLEQTVLQDGRFTDPFITWNGFIIDGHTRYRIMQNHPEVDLQPYEKKMDDVLPDRYAAIVWIATHQKSRRNLNDFEWNDIFKKAYDAQKKSVGAPSGNTNNNPTAKSQSAAFGRLTQKKSGAHATAEALAKEFGVSVGRFRHGVRTSDALDEAERLVPGVKDAIKTERVKATQKAVESVLDIKDDSERKEYVQAVVNGEKPKPPKKNSQLRPMSTEMKEFTKKMLEVVADMEDDSKEYGLDDAIRDLNSAEDVFFTQIRFVLDERKNVINADERGREQVIGFIESVIKDLEELKGGF